MSSFVTSTRVLLVVIALLIGCLIALAAAMLARAAGASPTSAVGKAGVAFAGAVTITLLVFTSMGVL
ncbi:hypothetical protein [Nonomuraea sp. NPDC050310]|uniref:hypothetical protein n=1 Tax=Nonomuraea sp. NPDC050310 TaxID=3154935 RepID=UPI0034087A66